MVLKTAIDGNRPRLTFFPVGKARIIRRPNCQGKSFPGRSRSVAVNKVCRLLVATLLAWPIAGCASVSRPSWLNPGPAPVQQSRAQQFDPYPENEPGPQIVGARPREYEKPVPEAS